MPQTVGIRFRPSEKVQYFDASNIELKIGDRVLVETDTGLKEGNVAITPDQIMYSDLRGPMLPVLQKVDED